MAFGGKYNRKERVSLGFMPMGDAVHVNSVLFMLLLRCPSPGQGTLSVPLCPWLGDFVCFLTLWRFYDAQAHVLFPSQLSDQIQRTLFPLPLQNGIRIQNLGVFLVTGLWLLPCNSVRRAGGGEEREREREMKYTISPVPAFAQ